MTRAIVFVCMRIPVPRLVAFLDWNRQSFADSRAHVAVVCDEPTDAACRSGNSGIETLVYTTRMDVFSLARVANFGIRTMIDRGFDIVLKTDVDVYFPDLERVLAVTPTTVNVPVYHDAPAHNSPDCQHVVCRFGQGTVCMTSDNWSRLQGYDERMVGYGHEDNELCALAGRSGLSIDSSGFIVHVRHRGPTGIKWNRRSFNPLRTRQNRQIPLRDLGSQPDWGRSCLLKETS